MHAGGRCAYTYPGLAILSFVLAMNVVGDSLRDLLDPRFRNG